MRRLFLTLALLSLPFLSFGQAWTIDDCVEYALVHNPEILHRQFQYETQKEVLGETAVSRVPVIGVGVQETLHAGNTLLMYSVDENLTMSLTQLAATLEMPLLSGGRIPNTKNAELYTLKASAENIAVAKMNVRIRVAAAYLQLLSDLSQERIAREQVGLCQAQIAHVEKMVAEGRRTNADLAEFKSALSAAELSQTAARGKAIMSRIELVNLIGLDDESGFGIVELEEMVEDTAPVPVIPLLDDLEHHPAILSAKYGMTSAEYRVKAAQGAYYPQLSLFANYNNYFVLPIGYPDIHIGSHPDKTGWGALGVKLSVPILNLTTNRKVSKAKVALEDARVTLDESRKEISRQFREAYYRTLTARDRYTSAVKAESAAQEAYDYQKKMYDVGRSTTLELNQSRMKWFSAGEEVVRAKYEYLLRNRILGYYSNYAEE